MKVMVITPKFRYDTFAPDTPAFRAAELIFCDRRGTEADWLAAAGDAEVYFGFPHHSHSGKSHFSDAKPEADPQRRRGL